MHSRPTVAEIDLSALRHNLATVGAHVGPGVRMLAPLKADAYGHGMVRIAQECLAAGVEQIGVATVDEGIALRAAGISAPLVVFGPTLPEEAEQIVAHGLQVSVSSGALAEELNRAAAARNATVDLHLKVDTGLGRFGIWHEEAVAFTEALDQPHLRLIGVYTHFATADEADKSYAHVQLQAFRSVVNELRRRGRSFTAHAANSSAVLDLPAARFDLVRPGLILFGGYPSAEVSRLPLRPVMTLKSRLALVRELPSGRHLSYGRTFTTTRRSRIATVPIGYADGYRRAASNRGVALVHRQPCPVVGRVCMDQLLLDVTELPTPAQVGDEVVLWGATSLTVEAVARTMDTVPFEILCGLSRRVPRVYVEP